MLAEEGASDHDVLQPDSDAFVMSDGRTAVPRPFASTVELVDELRARLEALVRARSTPQALVLRCRIVLRAAQQDDPSNQQTAPELDCNRHTVGLWRQRFLD